VTHTTPETVSSMKKMSILSKEVSILVNLTVTGNLRDSFDIQYLTGKVGVEGR
jgi:hypothetical protein